MLHLQLEQRLRLALDQVLPGVPPDKILVRPCPDARFGDYQTSSLMALAKERKTNPRQLATSVLPMLRAEDLCEKIEVAGAGFLNFTLNPQALASALSTASADPSVLVPTASSPKTIIIDFSSPNVAKPMHVGHIRSTILGESLSRIFRLLGHRVIADNHIGDWGTQFGKLIVGWKTELNREALTRDPIAEMERLYKKINAASEADPTVLEQARAELVKLQNSDPENLAIWREMQTLSQAQFDAIYHRLGIRFDVTLGESFYNPRLKDLVQRLSEAGIAQESQGAKVVFFEEIPSLKDHPAIIQKSDGAANYATTDLATLEHRLEQWNPDEILYVTGAPQQLHFQQIFAIFRKAHPEAKCKLSHVWFGSILGEDGKPFKTRSGETVKLADLLDEAEERAYAIVAEKNPDLIEMEKREIARIVGLGAIKYADLLPNRQSDYVFSWDKMLAFSGNTAPYLQYAYTRVRSIFRKAGTWASSDRVVFSAPQEIALAKHLLNFGLVVQSVTEEYRPNYLCNYLYDLAGLFTSFYENCPVLKAAEPERSSRLALSDLTANVLKRGLDLLGIEVTEKM